MLSLANERDHSNDDIASSLKEDPKVGKFNEDDFYPLNVVMKGQTGPMSKAQSEEEGRIVERTAYQQTVKWGKQVKPREKCGVAKRNAAKARDSNPGQSKKPRKEKL